MAADTTGKPRPTAPARISTISRRPTAAHIYYKTKQDFIEGQWYQAAPMRRFPRRPLMGSIIAVDPASGETRWKEWMTVEPAHQRTAGHGGRTAVRRRSGRLPDGARRRVRQAAMEVSDRRNGHRAADQLLNGWQTVYGPWPRALPIITFRPLRSSPRARPERRDLWIEAGPTARSLASFAAQSVRRAGRQRRAMSGGSPGRTRFSRFAALK